MVRMETEVDWRLYSGVKFLATSLSRTALQLEQVQERLSSDVDSTLVNPQIRNVLHVVYAMVAEASNLLPQFSRYADTLASAPAEAPATGAHLVHSACSRLGPLSSLGARLHERGFDLCAFLCVSKELTKTQPVDFCVCSHPQLPQPSSSASHADAPFAGFQSLPTEVQHKILALAATNLSTAAALRRVNRSFEAHAWIGAHSHTTINLNKASNSLPLTLLPYLPRLTTIANSERLDPPETRFVDAVLTAQLPAWPNLVTLQYSSDSAHVPMFPQQLPAASQVTRFELQRAFQGAAIPGGDWPCALALALPCLQNLRSLQLACNVPPGCPEPRLCSHVSALTRLTHLHYTASANDEEGATACAHVVAAMTALSHLILSRWPSSTSTGDRSAWRALMGSLPNLHRLNSLRLTQWQLDTSCSAAYFSELGPMLTALRALKRISFITDRAVRQTAITTAANSAAGTALVQTISSLTQLQELSLFGLQSVTVCACTQHLASLTKLTNLTLVSLAAPVPLAPGVPRTLAAEGTFEQLLAGMTRLRTLTLMMVGLNGRSAMRVVSDIAPTLVHLMRLSLPSNQLGVGPATVLANSVRQLRALRSVNLGSNNALVDPCDIDGVAGNIADLN